MNHYDTTSNIRWENFSDAELVRLVVQLMNLISERFEMRARDMQELTGELNNDLDSRLI